MGPQARQEGWRPGCVQQARPAQEEDGEQDIAAQGGQSIVQHSAHGLTASRGSRRVNAAVPDGLYYLRGLSGRARLAPPLVATTPLGPAEPAPGLGPGCRARLGMRERREGSFPQLWLSDLETLPSPPHPCFPWATLWGNQAPTAPGDATSFPLPATGACGWGI